MFRSGFSREINCKLAGDILTTCRKDKLHEMAKSEEPFRILESLRSPVARHKQHHQDQSLKLTQNSNNFLPQQQRQLASNHRANNLHFDDDQNSHAPNLHRGHHDDNDDDSNRWQLVHYFQMNNTRLKLTPTFNAIANDVKNLDDKSVELLYSKQQQQQQLDAINLTDGPLVVAPASRTANHLIESIKLKLSTTTPNVNLNVNMQNTTTTKSTQLIKSADHLAQLSCDSGEMIVRLNFTEPFKGIVYPDHNRLSPCRFFGDGHHNYELRLPLRGCGTRQVSDVPVLREEATDFHSY